MDILDVKMPPAPEPNPEVFQEKEEYAEATKGEKKEMKKNITFKEEIVEEGGAGREDDIIQEEEDEEEDNRPPVPMEDVFHNIPKVQKVKKKCSQKQLEHLAKCRIKAQEKKAENKAFKDAQKEKQRRYVEAEKKEKERLKPKRVVKRIPKEKPRRRTPSPEIVYETESSEEEQPQFNSRQPIMHQLTAGQIRQLQQDAIAGYDCIRRKRKEVKNQQQQEQQFHQQSRGSGPSNDDPWGVCFN
jgi:hypothetical protein